VQFPISIELQRSYLLVALLLIVHAGAAACVIVLPWSWLVRGGVLLVIAASLAHALRPSKITALRLHKDAIEGVLANGERVALTILPGSTVFLWLVVLRLRSAQDAGIVNLSLLPDQMSTQGFRVLRLWLRWRPDPERVTNVS
jgi:hypothetical protein